MEMEKLESALNGKLDNALNVSEKEELEAWLEQDRAARNTAWWYERMAEAFSKVESVEAPEGLSEAVMARIDPLPVHQSAAKAQSPSFFTSLGAKAFGSLAVAASVVGLVFFAGPSPSNEGHHIRPVVEHQVEVTHETSEATYRKADLKLAQVSGDVKVLRHNQYDWEKVGSDSSLNWHDRIRTSGDAKAKIAYRDGTELKLKPGSMIEVLQNGVRVFHGKTWIQVVKKGRHFEARTPNLVASVRGTMYDVEVSYPSKPLEKAISDLTQRRELLVKSVSPEVYFRDFSLEAVSELANRDADFSVQSDVRVFESSVFVSPADVLGPDVSRGVVVSEGEGLSLSPQNWRQDLRTHSIAAEDFAEWGLEEQGERVLAQRPSSEAEQSVASPGEDGRRGPGDQSPDIEDLPRSQQDESLPSSAFEQLNQ